MHSSSRRGGVATAAVSLTALMFGLEISSVPVALPPIQSCLRSGFTALQWVVNAYTIASVMILVARD